MKVFDVIKYINNDNYTYRKVSNKQLDIYESNKKIGYVFFKNKHSVLIKINNEYKKVEI